LIANLTKTNFFKQAEITKNQVNQKHIRRLSQTLQVNTEQTLKFSMKMDHKKLVIGLKHLMRVHKKLS